eukprot:NODE_464_length_8145_cov_0.677977.p2 type:complete len:523 gc:universal NODE_464_length_8145_cov_0.677977:7714-6146(-)
MMKLKICHRACNKELFVESSEYSLDGNEIHLKIGFSSGCKLLWFSGGAIDEKGFYQNVSCTCCKKNREQIIGKFYLMSPQDYNLKLLINLVVLIDESGKEITISVPLGSLSLLSDTLRKISINESDLFLKCIKLSIEQIKNKIKPLKGCKDDKWKLAICCYNRIIAVLNSSNMENNNSWQDLKEFRQIDQSVRALCDCLRSYLQGNGLKLNGILAARNELNIVLSTASFWTFHVNKCDCDCAHVVQNYDVLLKDHAEIHTTPAKVDLNSQTLVSKIVSKEDHVPCATIRDNLESSDPSSSLEYKDFKQICSEDSNLFEIKGPTRDISSIDSIGWFTQSIRYSRVWNISLEATTRTMIDLFLLFILNMEEFKPNLTVHGEICDSIKIGDGQGSKGLTAQIDYLISKSKIDTDKSPINYRCVVEAKRQSAELKDQNRVQTAAECAILYANQERKPVFGILSNFKQWEFFKIEGEMINKSKTYVINTKNWNSVVESGTDKDILETVEDVFLVLVNFFRLVNRDDA